MAFEDFKGFTVLITESTHTNWRSRGMELKRPAVADDHELSCGVLGHNNFHRSFDRRGMHGR